MKRVQPGRASIPHTFDHAPCGAGCPGCDRARFRSRNYSFPQDMGQPSRCYRLYGWIRAGAFFACYFIHAALSYSALPSVSPQLFEYVSFTFCRHDYMVPACCHQVVNVEAYRWLCRQTMAMGSPGRNLHTVGAVVEYADTASALLRLHRSVHRVLRSLRLLPVPECGRPAPHAYALMQCPAFCSRVLSS